MTQKGGQNPVITSPKSRGQWEDSCSFFPNFPPAAFLPSSASACSDVTTPHTQPRPCRPGCWTEPGFPANPECEASARLCAAPRPPLDPGPRPLSRSPSPKSQGGRAFFRGPAWLPPPLRILRAAEEFATEGGGGRREAAEEEAEEEGRKMAAVELEWIPETLYNTAISAVVDNYIRSRRDIRSLPENIQFDVYYKVRAVAC